MSAREFLGLAIMTLGLALGLALAVFLLWELSLRIERLLP